MSNYYFDPNRRFIIEDFQKAKTFSSFLPGIAGKDGIPIWAFYVNRGQGISSFGIQNKNNPIMEFTPANGAYQTVSTIGFRTFVKDLDGGSVVEPFGADSTGCSRKMGIEKDAFFIEEDNQLTGLKTMVRYTTLANQPFGGLVRQTVFTNTSNKTKRLELVDGMPALLPYGVENEPYKAMSNLMQSWMEVSNKDSKVPFYKLRSSTGDTSMVTEVKSGYFYLSEKVMDDSVLNIYDPNLVFSYQSDLRLPVGFSESNKEALAAKEQVYANKVPSAFQLVSGEIKPSETMTINSVVGFARNYEAIADFTEGIDLKSFVDSQFDMTKATIEEICQDIETKTGLPVFDEYIKQSYLDNVLRGGKPYLFEAGEGNHVYHIFSRKHGDLERDYNFFSLEPSKFSQGNGNYRDVNQNRRNDVIMNPKVGDFNIWMFYNLVQADGYNPLGISGTVFTVAEDRKGELQAALQSLKINEGHIRSILAFVSDAFTPGTFMAKLEELSTQDEAILAAVLKVAKQDLDVVFGEGFWSDHFTYNLDLVQSYLYVYPDCVQDLLLGRKDYRFFNAPYQVLPREAKYGINDNGDIRQYESIIKKDLHTGTWMEDGSGKTVTTDLLNKMLTLVLTKSMILDPFGMGLEMEGDKPGWNDALNGLPGLFGSGMSETIELKKHIDWLVEALRDLEIHETDLLKITSDLMTDLMEVFSTDMPSFDRWEKLNLVKDAYRNSVSTYISPDITAVAIDRIIDALKAISKVLGNGLEEALKLGDGLMPSYFVNEVTDHEVLDSKTHFGLQAVKAKGFSHRRLPFFLEGPARYMKTIQGESAMALHKKVKASGIYDQGIGMYKTSESLDGESMEIGRIRAFTPGWLERESVFLHMTYKYLLSLLQSGSYEAFYEAVETNMVPFLDPAVYGRPTTENSSFLASSVNPNPAVVGQGFVARLSGSTAELISMWVKMFIGAKGFTMTEEGLRFDFAPVLQGRFFDEEGKVTYTLFGKTKVTYLNESRKDTFGNDGAKVVKVTLDGEELTTTYLTKNEALRLRNGLVQEIVVILN